MEMQKIPGVKKKIEILERILAKEENVRAVKGLNISLGKVYIEMASSFDYGPEYERVRTKYLIKSIRAYENAGFKTGSAEEKRRLYHLYRYASNICAGIGMIKEGTEFLQSAHDLGKSAGIINL